MSGMTLSTRSATPPRAGTARRAADGAGSPTPSRGAAAAGAVTLHGRRRRNPALVLLSALLIAGSAAGFGALYMQAGERTEVLVAARDIPVGAVIAREDLATAEISGSGLSAIAVGDATKLVGQTAVAASPRGALLAWGDATRTVDLPPGQTAIALALPASALPSILAGGRSVALYREGDAGQPIAPNAKVLGVTTGGDNRTTVTLAVNASNVEAIAAAGGKITLAVLPLRNG